MALRCFSSPLIIIQEFGSSKKAVNRVLNFPNSQLTVEKTTSLQITSSIRNKVFEDQTTGVVCYRDENGEIICEGYDEGPRLQTQFSKTTHSPRDAEIIDLLQKNWLQIVEGGEPKPCSEWCCCSKRLQLE